MNAEKRVLPDNKRLVVSNGRIVIKSGRHKQTKTASRVCRKNLEQ